MRLWPDRVLAHCSRVQVAMQQTSCNDVAVPIMRPGCAGADVRWIIRTKCQAQSGNVR
jgi:hypothetical protein